MVICERPGFIVRVTSAAALVLSLSALSPLTGHPQDQAVTEPKLLSILPLGGRPGTTVQGEVHGELLEGAYAVWFDTDSLNGRLLKVEKMKEEQAKEKVKVLDDKAAKPRTVYRALIEVAIQPTAHIGIHSVRLVSPRGISDTVSFAVVDDPVVMEMTNPHQTVEQAQALKFP